MQSPITVEHNDITITYNEYDDLWEFELRGRSRKADSLATAKEFIDKPPSTPKSAKPAPVEGWMQAQSSFLLWEKVAVTSVDYVGEKISYVWVTCNGRRSKEDLSCIYASTPENDAIREEIGNALVAISQAQKRKRDLFTTLKPVDISSFDLS